MVRICFEPIWMEDIFRLNVARTIHELGCLKIWYSQSHRDIPIFSLQTAIAGGGNPLMASSQTWIGNGGSSRQKDLTGFEHKKKQTQAGSNCELIRHFFLYSQANSKGSKATGSIFPNWPLILKVLHETHRILPCHVLILIGIPDSGTKPETIRNHWNFSSMACTGPSFFPAGHRWESRTWQLGDRAG